MAIQNQTYKTRLLTKSTLSPQARLVALVIAELRYAAKKHSHEPMPLAGAQLAAQCGMSERTLDRYLGECLAAGWVVGRSVFRDGRQKPNEYFLTDPTDEAECRRLHAVIASGGQLLSAGVAGISRRRLHTVVRSNNKFGDDGAAPRGDVGDEQDTQNRVTPEPALAGASPDEPQTETQLLASMRSPRQTRLWPHGNADQQAITELSRCEADDDGSGITCQRCNLPIHHPRHRKAS